MALYGLSHVKDERLHRLFRENKVEFELPVAEEGRCDLNFEQVMIVIRNSFFLSQGVVPHIGASPESSQAGSNKFHSRVFHPRFFPPGHLGP